MCDTNELEEVTFYYKEGHSFTVKRVGCYLKVIADAVDRHLLIDSSGNIVTDSLPGKNRESK